MNIGQRLPQARFFSAQSGVLETVESDTIFTGRRVALFAVPGAFTPTCSSAHVPRFEGLFDALRQQGVDDVVCVAVNDPYVLDAWRRQLGCERLRFLADPSGEFAEAMGLLKKLGPLGARSRRYSLLVQDGVVEQAFVEADRDDDPYEVSDADTLLKAIGGHGAAAPFFLFAREYCPYCARAKAELERRGIPYEAAYLGRGLSMEAVHAASGRRTVPQLFRDGRAIGGLDELLAMFAATDGDQPAAASP